MRAPSPPATPLIGHARRFQRDPLGYLLRTAREFGPVVRLQLGPLTYHLVTGPDAVDEILTVRATNYLRDTRSSRNIRL
ncbi:MAG TPA: cytochrome P450, partial [Candidatus Synoicihabitans sp.]|nr:cytochrome P450 [Candidatus Synoicihabitans sp.]